MKTVLINVLIIGSFILAPLMTDASVIVGDVNSGGGAGSLIGYWPLNDGSGSTPKDTSGHNNKAILTGSPVWTTGKFSYALSFTGSPQTASTTLAFPTSSGSLSVWVYPTSYYNWISPAGWKLSGTNQGDVLIDEGGGGGSGQWRAVFSPNNTSGPGESDAVGKGTIVQNVWQQVMMSWSLSGSTYTISLYVNGVLQNTATWTGTLGSAGMGHLHFGSSGDYPDNYFLGKVDDVRVYNYALSASQAQALYQSGIPVLKADHVNTTALSQGLVGYWPLDGNTISWTTNTFNDTSGNSNNATSTGMSTSTSIVAGHIGQALKFNGSSQYLSVPSSSSLNLSSNLTISAWVYPTAFGSLEGIVSKYNSNSGNEYLLRLSGSSPYNTIDCGGATDFSGTTPLSLNRWQFVACTISGTTGKIYINGTLDSTGTVSVSTGSDPVTIGSDFLPSKRVWNGRIDDVRIYNRPLSSAEIAQLYALGQANIAHSDISPAMGVNAGLVGLWTFDGNATNWTANTTADSSGGGNNATMNNFSKTKSPVAGKIGQAFAFNGSSQYLSHAHIPELDFGTGDFSVSFWIKPSGSWGGTTRGIIGQKSNDSAPGWQVYHDAGDTNAVRLRLGDASGNGSDLMGVAVAPGVWTYVTVERKSGVLYGYSNGAPSGTSIADTKNVSGGSANFNIGYADTWTAYYQGSLDDVRIYNRALSAQEVAALYAMGR
jgi:hypothetical protein